MMNNRVYDKEIKKWLLAGVLGMVMFFSMVLRALAAEGSVTYGSSSYSPTQGENFQIGVYVKGSEAVGAYEFYLDYDASMLEYVSGADSGGGGRLKFVGYGNADNYSYMLTFKAISAGSSNVSISNVYMGALNSAADMTITAAASATVSVQGPNTASGDNKLASLTVSPTGLWGFSPDVFEYDITVANDVSRLSISAATQSDKATHVISDTNLEVGVNTITIKVTAENGSVQNYTIIVRRKPADEQTETTTQVQVPEIEDLNASFTVNGKEMYFVTEIDDVTIPDGFEATTITYKEEEVPAFASTTQNVTLFYLADGLGENKAFFVYNAETDTVYPFIRLTNSSYSYILVTADESVAAPDGYIPTTVALSNGGDENISTNVTAWVNDNEAEFFLIYALNNKGEIGFYQYDSKEMTIQRYHEQPAKEQETVIAQPENSDKITELENSIIKLRLANQKDSKTKLLVIIILAVFSVILVIAVIGLFLKLKGQFEDEMELADEDEEAYDDEEDREPHVKAASFAQKAEILRAAEQMAAAEEDIAADDRSPKESNPVEKKEEDRDKLEEEPKETEEQLEERKEEKDELDIDAMLKDAADLLDLDDDDFTFY